MQKKALYKTSIRSIDKIKMEQARKLVEKIDEMQTPFSGKKKVDIYEQFLKLLPLVPDLLTIMNRMEGEYQTAMAATESAVNIMEKKGRAARKTIYSEANAERYHKLLEKLANTNLNQNNHMALRTEARRTIDYDDGRKFQRQGSWGGK